MTAVAGPAPTSGPGRLGRLRRDLRREETRWAFLFLLPWIVGFILFTLGPMIASLVLSFFHWSVLGTPRFAGLENYAQAFTARDPLYWRSWERTWVYALLFIPSGLSISLLLAAMLNQHLKGTTIFRTLFFIPTLVPVVASALLWRWMLQPDVGLVNYLLWEMRIPGPRWMASVGLSSSPWKGARNTPCRKVMAMLPCLTLFCLSIGCCPDRARRASLSLRPAAH